MRGQVLYVTLASLHNCYSSLQVDLVDMRSCGDRGYRWIGHYIQRPFQQVFNNLASKKEMCRRNN